MRTPACFETARQWREYQKLWMRSKEAPIINYCVDCTPDYKRAMMEEKRCAYPSTTFKIKEGELVGVRDKIHDVKRRGFVVDGVVIR